VKSEYSNVRYRSGRKKHQRREHLSRLYTIPLGLKTLGALDIEPNSSIYSLKEPVWTMID
jgi:hypothetical protein